MKYKKIIFGILRDISIELLKHGIERLRTKRSGPNRGSQKRSSPPKR